MSTPNWREQSKTESSVLVGLAAIWMLLGPAAVPVGAATAAFTTKSGLLDQTDATSLGLSMASGTESFHVVQATASNDHYRNQVSLIPFQGMLYCQWQSSAQNEDSSDTWTACSRSSDGKTWSAPIKIAGPDATYYRTSGGWWVNGDTLVAYVNVWTTALTPRGGSAWYSTSLDGTTWSTLKPLSFSDGTAMNGVLEQDPHALADGRILNTVYLQPGQTAQPIYTDDRSGIRGWKKAKYTALAGDANVSREIEGDWFQRSDSTLVQVWRDQTGFTYRKLVSTSTDRGASWTSPVVSDMPDSRSKQSAGNLPEGTAYIVSNPVDTARRSPLAIVLSKDGKTFDHAYVQRKGGSSLPARRYDGHAKTLGYSYPKSVVWNGYLYSGYSVNKEDIDVTRIPLGSLQLNATGTDPRASSELAPRSFLHSLVLSTGPTPRVATLLRPDGTVAARVTGNDRIEIGQDLPRGLYLLRLEGAGESRTAPVAKIGDR